MKTWPDKDKDEVLEYGFNWSPRGLGTDTITVSTAVVQNPGVTPIVVDAHIISAVDGAAVGQGTVTWLSGGVPGTTYQILLKAETAAGRKMDETMSIMIKER